MLIYEPQWIASLVTHTRTRISLPTWALQGTSCQVRRTSCLVLVNSEVLHSWSTLLLLCSQRAGEFGPGTKDFWLDDVKCTGDERSIALCSHREWGRHNCLDFNQAGVVCKLRLKDKITTPEPAKPGDEVMGLSCHVTIWSRCYVKHK